MAWVAVPSTAAQYFHLLRRQALRSQGKPLVVMTPKSLLRLAAARSAAEDFADGSFRGFDDFPGASGNVCQAVHVEWGDVEAAVLAEVEPLPRTPEYPGLVPGGDPAGADSQLPVDWARPTHR